MSILSKPDAELRREMTELRRELVQLKTERDALQGQLEGKPDLMWWVQAKVYRQQKALNQLHTRVVSQRFQLRTLEELGRGLTRDEYLEARGKVGNEQLRDRIEVPAA